MFDTIEEVLKNKYINNLVNEASSFNMYSTYVKYTKAKKPQNNGIYFVYGYDKDKILDETLDIEKLYELQYNEKGVRLDLNITKITNQSPFAAHQEVMYYCLHASTLRAICNMCGYKNDFTVVTPVFADALETFYLNSINKSISLKERERNRIAMKNFLEDAGEEQKIIKGYNLDGPEVHLRPEKLDKKYPNMVSLTELHFRTVRTEQLTVALDVLEQIKKELLKHPEILYFQAKPVAVRSKIPKEQGGGISSSVTIIYDAFYEEQMHLISLKIGGQSCFRFSVQDLREKYGDVCSVGIAAKNIDTIFERAAKHSIPICIDADKLYFTFDKNNAPRRNVAGYNVVFPKKFVYEMDAILQSEANRMRDTRILTKEDEEKYSYQQSKPIHTQSDLDMIVNDPNTQKRGFFNR